LSHATEVEKNDYNEEIDKDLGSENCENKRSYFSMGLLSKLNQKKEDLIEKYLQWSGYYKDELKILIDKINFGTYDRGNEGSENGEMNSVSLSEKMDACDISLGEEDGDE